MHICQFYCLSPSGSSVRFSMVPVTYKVSFMFTCVSGTTCWRHAARWCRRTTPSGCRWRSGTGTERPGTTSWARCRSACLSSSKTPSTAGTNCSVRRKENSTACRVQTRSLRVPSTCRKPPDARYQSINRSINQLIDILQWRPYSTQFRFLTRFSADMSSWDTETSRHHLLKTSLATVMISFSPGLTLTASIYSSSRPTCLIDLVLGTLSDHGDAIKNL